jgi:hypothetical protein
LVLSEAVLFKDIRGHRLNTLDELTIPRLMQEVGACEISTAVLSLEYPLV